MKLWRIVLVWCLAVALPGQAFAAALSAACLQAHGQPLVAVAVAPAVAPAVVPCHGVAHGVGKAADDGGTPQAHQCSACAACGLGAAWIPAPWAAPAAERPEAWLQAGSVAVPPALNAGQYKPPRTRSA